MLKGKILSFKRGIFHKPNHVVTKVYYIETLYRKSHMAFQYNLGLLILDDLKWSNEGHITFKMFTSYMINILTKVCMNETHNYILVTLVF